MASDDGLVYLISTAGHPNLGDELLTLGWLRFLARVAPRREVWLDCPNPGRASILFADSHPHLHTTNTLWEMCHQVPVDGGAAQAVTDVSRLIRDFGTPRADLGLLTARRATMIHVLGGGYLNSIWPHHNLLLPAAAELRRQTRGSSLIATGQGLLPQDDEWSPVVKQSLAEFDYAEARDRRTAQEFGIGVGVDDVFLTIAEGAIRTRDSASEAVPERMVLIQGDLHDEPVDPAAVVEKVVEYFLSTGSTGSEEIGLMEALPLDDSWILEHLSDRWPGSVHFYPFADLWRSGLPIVPGQQWVSTRFHLHLLAAAMGATGVTMNVSREYYGLKHASLRALGTSWDHLGDFSELSGTSIGVGETPPDRSESPSSFPGRARELAGRKQDVAQQLYRSVTRSPSLRELLRSRNSHGSRT